MGTKRPDNWREKIIELYPDKEAPLLKMLREGKRTTFDREFRVFERPLPPEPHPYAGLILVPEIDADTPEVRLEEMKDADKLLIRIGRAHE